MLSRFAPEGGVGLLAGPDYELAIHLVCSVVQAHSQPSDGSHLIAGQVDQQCADLVHHTRTSEPVSYASDRLSLGRTSVVLDWLLRWEIEEQFGEILRPGEHRIVTRREFDEPPLGTVEFAEQGLAAGDHLHTWSSEKLHTIPTLG